MKLVYILTAINAFVFAQRDIYGQRKLFQTFALTANVSDRIDEVDTLWKGLDVLQEIALGDMSTLPPFIPTRPTVTHIYGGSFVNKSRDFVSITNSVASAHIKEGQVIAVTGPKVSGDLQSKLKELLKKDRFISDEQAAIKALAKYGGTVQGGSKLVYVKSGDDNIEPAYIPS